MDIQLKHFHELTTQELYDILRMREEIFILEQDAVFNNLDGLDQKALHLILRKDGAYAAYARLFRSGDYYEEASLGRVITPEDFRGEGFGEVVVSEGIKALLDLGETKIKIAAMAYAEEFYAKLGFRRTEREPFIEDNYLHVEIIYENE